MIPGRSGSFVRQDDPGRSCTCFPAPCSRGLSMFHVEQFNPCELEYPGSRRGRNAEFAGGRVLEGSHRFLPVGTPLADRGMRTKRSSPAASFCRNFMPGKYRSSIKRALIGSFVFMLKSQVGYEYAIKVIIFPTRIEADFCKIHTDKTLPYQ